MSGSSEMEALATGVVDLLYGAMYKKTENLSLPHPDSLKDVPEEIRQRIMADSAINAERLKAVSAESQRHRKMSIELHMKHLSKEQLEALISFHESDMGQSINKAQIHIQNELSKGIRDSEKKSGKGSGMATVRIREKFE